MLVTTFSLPAGAASKAKPCQQACDERIAACTNRTQEFGNLQRACRMAVLKRCRKAGPTVCASTTSTTTTSTTTTTLHFADNSDGTVTDNQTGLQWEKKIGGSNCPHCVNDSYTLANTRTLLDGTAYSTFLKAFKGCSTVACGSCLAGHCDWRLPTSSELLSIVDQRAPGCGFGTLPCIDPVFGPTAPGIYWSDTFNDATPLPPPTPNDFHEYVDFGLGNDGHIGNVYVPRESTESHLVRAVRGGS